MGERITATTLAPEMTPDEQACLTDTARQAARGGLFLEIGTAGGGSLCLMQKAFTAEKRPRFVVIDPMSYFQNQLELVRKNLTQNGLDPDAVEFRQSTSVEAFPGAAAAREAYDFMLIDGDHKIRGVARDFRWLRLLKPGGIVCFHDYGPAEKGVKLNVDRLLRNPAYRRERLANTLIVIRKEARSGTTEGGFGHLLWANMISPLLQWEKSFKKRMRKKQALKASGT